VQGNFYSELESLALSLQWDYENSSGKKRLLWEDEAYPLVLKTHWEKTKNVKPAVELLT
jgi:hypothetical protein